MAKTIVVGGYGPGISSAVAQKFGAEGFQVALVGRTASKLAAGTKALEAKGVRAAAFPANLAEPAAVRAVVRDIRAALGPITILQWTAYSNAAGDLLTADEAAVRGALDVGITGLLAAVQESLADLRREKDAAVLVTNGGLGYFDANIDAMAVQWNAMGLAVVNAAKHKMVGVLAQKLKADGVYVGEVVVLGTVKGTAFDDGHATIDASAVAAKFWDLYKARREVSAQIG